MYGVVPPVTVTSIRPRPSKHNGSVATALTAIGVTGVKMISSWIKSHIDGVPLLSCTYTSYPPGLAVAIASVTVKVFVVVNKPAGLVFAGTIA